MKHIPNIISIFRMLLSVVLLFLPIIGVPFYTVYFLCGLSDVMDGFLARKLKCVSKLGDLLDKYADLVLFIILVLKLALVINFEQWVVVSLVVLVAMRVAVAVAKLIKFKKLRIVNSYLNKASEFSVYLFPVFYIVIGAGITTGIVLSAAAISAIEEFAIILTLKEFDEEKKSIFPLK